MCYIYALLTKLGPPSFYTLASGVVILQVEQGHLCEERIPKLGASFRLVCRKLLFI